MSNTTHFQRPPRPPQDALVGPSSRSIAPLAAVAAVAGALLFLMLLSSVGYQMAHSGNVYPGVRVDGISVGGMSKEKALSELRPLFEERIKRPVLIRMAGEGREATLPELGASFNAAAAVEVAFAVGREGNFFQQAFSQWGALVGGHAVEAPGLAVDRAKLRTLVESLARGIDRPVREAELTIGSDQSVKVSTSVVGRKMDVAGAVAAIEKGLGTAAPIIDLPVAETRPKRVEQDLESARLQLTKMFSGPVSLEFNDKKWPLTVKEIAALVAVDQKTGAVEPAVSFQEKPLSQLVDKIAEEVDQPKINARYDYNGGALALLKQGQDGRKVNREQAITALKTALSTDTRSVPLPVEVAKAAGGSLNPADLGIKERIDFGRTAIAGVPEKIHNIKLAASRLNGVLLAPGDIFSFNREIGPTTLKSGFQTGFGISVANGQMETVPSVAGGICQVSTTLLHAVFWAGYQIEERYPHLYWIQTYGQPPRGIVGLDATVDDPSLDFKFMNNTDNYLLIGSSVANNQLEFSLYGTKPTWKVDVEGPIITNVRKADPAMVIQYEPSWPVGKQLQVERATDGMDVSIIRRVTEGGETRTLTLKSAYQPSRNVTMKGGTKAQPEAAPTPEPSETPEPQPTAPGAPASPTAKPGGTAVPAAPTPKPAATQSAVRTPAPAAIPAAPVAPTPTPARRG